MIYQFDYSFIKIVAYDFSLFVCTTEEHVGSVVMDVGLSIRVSSFGLLGFFGGCSGSF